MPRPVSVIPLHILRGRPASRRIGFTLVELLAAVAVVGILAAILLPALSTVRKQARKAVEISAARQLVTAYHAHAADRRGRLMPGEANGYETRILEPVYNLRGQKLNDTVAKRFPWRLVPYLNRSVEGTLLLNESVAEAKGWNDYDYNVSLLPSLGINSTYVGTAQDYRNAKGEVIGPGAYRHAIQRFEQARSPETLIVFASAAGQDDKGGRTHGFWQLSAPYDSAKNGRWSAEPPDPAWPVLGQVHLRWSGKAVVAHLDSSVKLLGETELRDMRRWANAAAVAGETDWQGD
jgi:prepilin-type N-terminal cleavage/methylation domain-containing protein